MQGKIIPPRAGRCVFFDRDGIVNASPGADRRPIVRADRSRRDADTPLPADDQSFIKPTDKNTFVAMLAEMGIGVIKAVQTVIGLFGAVSA